jgi:hypothetical protein
MSFVLLIIQKLKDTQLEGLSSCFLEFFLVLLMACFALVELLWLTANDV